MRWLLYSATLLYHLLQVRRWYTHFKPEEEEPLSLWRYAPVHAFHTVFTIEAMLLTPSAFLVTEWLHPAVIAIRVALVFVTASAWFYASHRLMHTKTLYRWHKAHHVFRMPGPLATLYCSTLEHVVVNMGSLFVPLLLFPVHHYVALSLSFLMMHNSVGGHMGTEYAESEHFYHHHDGRYNFGSGSWLDKLAGTWKDPRYRTRH